MSNRSPTRTGRCLCGNIRYKVRGDPIVVAHCYCENCQRGSGAGHTTGAMYSADTVRVEGHISEFKYWSGKGNEVTRVFCSNCGSPIFGRNSAMVGFVTIPLGTLEDSSELHPQVVIFARNRKPWDVIDNALPSFDTQPDWKPEKGL